MLGTYDIVAHHERSCDLAPRKSNNNDAPHIPNIAMPANDKAKTASSSHIGEHSNDIAQPAHRTAPSAVAIASKESAAMRREVRQKPEKMAGSTELNEEQQKAAYHPADQPLMILAGAGSGKTKTLISRIRFLHEEGMPLDRILVLTFSTAATKELSHRVKQVHGDVS